MYVEWNASKPNTDPLLLRYLVEIQGPSHNGTTVMNFDLLSEKRNVVIVGLEPNAAYQVAVRASSLVGVAPLPSLMEVITFPNGESCDWSCDFVVSHMIDHVNRQARLSLCMCEFCMFVCLRAVPTEPYPSQGIRAGRTEDKTNLVIQWEPFVPTQGPTPQLAGYQVAYRLEGGLEGSGRKINVTQERLLLVVDVDRDQEASYEVSVCVCVCVCAEMCVQL